MYFNITVLNENVHLCFLAFVKSERPKKYPGLTVKYVRGANPIIKLMNEKKEVIEEIGIDKWNTDSMEEFLSEHLKI